EESLDRFELLSLAGVVAVVEHFHDGASLEEQPGAGIVAEPLFRLDVVASFRQTPPGVFERHVGKAPLRNAPPRNSVRARKPPTISQNPLGSVIVARIGLGAATPSLHDGSLLFLLVSSHAVHALFTKSRAPEGRQGAWVPEADAHPGENHPSGARGT